MRGERRTRSVGTMSDLPEGASWTETLFAAQRGDREAFAILARTHSDRLYAIAQRILRDAGLAEDALQQALVTPWRELPALRDPDKFLAWSTRALVHECYAEARRRTRHDRHVRIRVSRPTLRRGLSTRSPRSPTATSWNRAFRRLPDDQRAVLVLHHYLGLEPTEIAQTLGVPAGTVRSRLHYAHRAMRAALEADERTPWQPGGATDDDVHRSRARPDPRPVLRRGPRRGAGPGDRPRPRPDRPRPPAAHRRRRPGWARMPATARCSLRRRS